MKNKDKLIELFKNEHFKELIVDKYLGSDIKELVFTQNLDEKETIDELKARQKLRLFFDIIISEQD